MLKERSLEVSIISIIFLVVIILFGFKPIANNLHEALLDVKVKKETLNKKQAKLDNLNSMKAQLSSLKENLNLMKKALPSSEDMPGILVSIEAMVGQSGLAFASLAPERTKAAPVTSSEESTSSGIPATVEKQVEVASIAYDLSLQGGYPSLITFLENIEKNVRPTNITLIHINSGSKDKPATISVKVNSYYQK